MVIFFDIDGTIVDNDTQIIPESTIRAVEQLGKNGHLAVVNTGRPYTHVDPRVRKMAFGSWICACGMEIRLNDQRLSYVMPDEALQKYSVEAAMKYGMEPLFEADDGSIELVNPDTANPFVSREARLMKGKGFAVNSVFDHPSFMKFVTWDNPGCRRQEFIGAMAPYYTCILRENNLIELVPKGCSKAEGMKLLLKHLGSAPEDTMAIGDSTNDLPMFSVARHTVCMGNGMEELKAKAEFITASVLDDGIEKALKAYDLI